MPKGGNMENAKVFISHSHKDKIIATALVDLLIKLGLDRKNIIASSAAKAQLHAGSSLYEELRTALSNKNVLVIFLLKLAEISQKSDRLSRSCLTGHFFTTLDY